jgi:iron complex outermembrane receptor protein
VTRIRPAFAPATASSNSFVIDSNKHDPLRRRTASLHHRGNTTMKLTKTRISLAVLAALTSSHGAFAQEAAATKKTGQEDVSVIVVTGIAGSVESSLNQKRRSTNMVEAITAEDIGKFPDTNLSESLQRVPGVTLERNNTGDGSAINLRGLGPQFTTVTINGMTGVSSGTDNNFGNSNGSRGFNFEILPSELFTNAVINKTVNATQIEGGLAGVVELQTPRPFENKGFHFVAAGKGNYSTITGDVDPRGTLLISNTWGREFGLSASLAAADTRYRSDTAQGGVYRAFSNSNTGTRASDAIRALDVANGTRYITYDDTRKTVGGTLTAQWRPTRELEFTMDALYGDLSSKRNITRDDAAIEGGANIPLSTTVTGNLISAGQFTGIQQRVGTNYQTTEEDMKQVSLQGKWRPDGTWTIKPYVSYAKRKAERGADLYSFRLASPAGVFDPGVVSYQVRGDYVDWSSSATDFSTNPQAFLFNTFVFRPVNDTDMEKSAKIDIEKELDGQFGMQTLKFGARTAKHEKDTFAREWRFNRATGVATTAVPNLGSAFAYADFYVNGAGGAVPGQLLIADPDKVRSVFFPTGTPIAGLVRSDLTGNNASRTYNIQENTDAAYVSGAFEFGATNVEAGVRYVRTEQISAGNVVENANLATQRITPTTIVSNYHYFLPSVNARYEFSPSTIVRAAFSKTLTRPDLNQMAPSETVAGIDASGGRGTKGNPDLKPYTSKNFDLGLEWYADKTSMLGLSFFRKAIDGYIDVQATTEIRSFPRQADGVIVSGPIVFTKPFNSVSATINGVELAAQTRFSMLPQPWMRNFGGIFNYTYAKSSADFAVVNDVRSSGLPGLSKNSYNATLYYDDGTFDGRLSYAWRGRYLAQFADDFAVPRFRDAYGQIDLSASYKVNKRWSIQLDVLNLTKSQFKDKASTSMYPFGVYELDRRIMIGARYAL